MERYDVIVIGAGGVGSAAFYHLSRRGAAVLALDQFPQAHSHGSSHGQSRIIRQAYFEHPDYVPLLKRAYELWSALESESGRKLFHQHGLLEIGPPDGFLISGILQSVREHNLPIEEIPLNDARHRFPFRISEGMQVLFEPTAGYLLVEDCVQTHLDLALRNGGSWKQLKVVSWSANENGVKVDTETERFEAKSLIICGGAWAASLLSDIGVPLRIVSKHQYWFDSSSAKVPQDLPTYFFELESGCFYGFPEIDVRGLKIARHTGGVEHCSPPALLELRDKEDERLVRQFAENHLLENVGAPTSHQACMYTLSPDEHFIIDRHPAHQNVCFAGGLSGHGFKFTTVLGESLAELVSSGSSDPHLDFLSLDRFDSRY